MNDLPVVEPRIRNRTLFIVEGHHEKHELFGLMLQCFPEIPIRMECLWIYGTNIYMLYEDIVKEYGEDWTDLDVDPPFVISKKKNFQRLRYKADFVNIVLVFDYERHDANFSEDKIVEMQNYFTDAADTGKLYLNYPMIESYRHLKGLPDEGYADRKVAVTLQPGIQYKRLVKQETVVAECFYFLFKADALLEKRFLACHTEKRRKCCKKILELSVADDMKAELEKILQGTLEGDVLQTAKYQFAAMLSKLGYIYQGKSFWDYMRMVFQQIIFHNIGKANYILNGEYILEADDCKACLDSLNLTDILVRQNLCSRDPEHGCIWVLNTCVLFVGEYNFALLLENRLHSPIA